MKKLSTILESGASKKDFNFFQFSGASRKLIDNYFVENNYKIYKITFIDTPTTQLILYKNSVFDKYIECLFCNDKLQTINFSIDENYIKTMY